MAKFAFLAFILLGSILALHAADPGQPLYLSNYLNNPSLGQKLSQVNGIGNYTSYSGYFTVNGTTGSNTFFWFFPAQSGDAKAPVAVWLQGGPGASSLFSLFSETGPFSVADDGVTLIPTPYTWNKDFSMIYVDNPVGTGFSFTQMTSGFCTDQICVGENLYSFITQFFTIFPQYANNDFYITGESYGGKYIPSFAYTIHQKNVQSSQKINLKGIAIGDGAMDPITQFTGFSDLLYFVGMADEEEQEVIRGYEGRIIEGIAAGDYVRAFHAFDEFLNGDFYPYPTYFMNITGTNNYFNFLDPVYPSNPFPQFLNMDSTRAAIHVGTVPYFEGNSTVEYYLLNDWMKSVAPILPTLLENYKVMVYNGQLDLILGPPLTEKFLRVLAWSGQSQYNAAPKKVWKVGSDVAGYVRQVKNFTQVVVRKAGHLLPADQPEAAYVMITNFVYNRPFKS